MAYTALTTVSDIQVYFKGITFSATTTPSDTTVSEFIDRATSIIYGAIQDKYAIPITDACDLLQLQELAELYVLTKVKMIMGKASPRVLRDGKWVATSEDLSEFYDRLEKYTSCEIVLPNSDLSSSSLMSDSYNDDNDIVTVSRKCEDIW